MKQDIKEKAIDLLFKKKNIQEMIEELLKEEISDEDFIETITFVLILLGKTKTKEELDEADKKSLEIIKDVKEILPFINYIPKEKYRTYYITKFINMLKDSSYNDIRTIKKYFSEYGRNVQTTIALLPILSMTATEYLRRKNYE